jgi:hypothetical protein
LVDFGLAQCVTTDFPMVDTPAQTLNFKKRKREEVNIDTGVINDLGIRFYGSVSFRVKFLCPHSSY